MLGVLGSMSSTEAPNTRSTRSTRSIGPRNTPSTSSIESVHTRNTPSTSSIPEYRTPKYSEYTKYLKFLSPILLTLPQGTRSICARFDCRTPCALRVGRIYDPRPSKYYAIPGIRYISCRRGMFANTMNIAKRGGRWPLESV